MFDEGLSFLIPFCFALKLKKATKKLVMTKSNRFAGVFPIFVCNRDKQKR